MGDEFTIADFVKAQEWLESQPGEAPQYRYFATASEMANLEWVAWFKENFPEVELVEIKPLPVLFLRVGGIAQW